MKDVKELRGEDYGFLVLGSPTKMTTMSWTVRRFIGKKIKGEEWANKPFTAFDTEGESVIRKGGGSAAEKISEKLKTKGLKRIEPVLKIAVLGIKGPLKDGEIDDDRDQGGEGGEAGNLERARRLHRDRLHPEFRLRRWLGREE